ncbi:hypothetical protein OK074_7376 [Actinobacteria bacterium OK074]|nr:hypothetical protein OK074_7376 [Actinobacteria bacterium OK074]
MTHPRIEQLRLLQRIHFSQGIHFDGVEGCRIRSGLNEIIYRHHEIGM